MLSPMTAASQAFAIHMPPESSVITVEAAILAYIREHGPASAALLREQIPDFAYGTIRGKLLALYKQGALRRDARGVYALADGNSERWRPNHRRLDPVLPLGPIGAVAADDTQPRLDERGVDLIGSRVITESHDEGGLQWAVEVRFWSRSGTRRLGLTTRMEHVADAPRDDA